MSPELVQYMLAYIESLNGDEFEALRRAILCRVTMGPGLTPTPNMLTLYVVDRKAGTEEYRTFVENMTGVYPHLKQTFQLLETLSGSDGPLPYLVGYPIPSSAIDLPALSTEEKNLVKIDYQKAVAEYQNRTGANISEATTLFAGIAHKSSSTNPDSTKPEYKVPMLGSIKKLPVMHALGADNTIVVAHNPFPGFPPISQPEYHAAFTESPEKASVMYNHRVGIVDSEVFFAKLEAWCYENGYWQGVQDKPLYYKGPDNPHARAYVMMPLKKDPYPSLPPLLVLEANLLFADKTILAVKHYRNRVAECTLVAAKAKIEAFKYENGLWSGAPPYLYPK